MKVLHLSSERGWRGGEQQIAYLLPELARLGVTSLVAARSGSVFEKHCRENGIPVFPVAFKSSFDLRTALAIKMICKKENIDLVHIHSAKSHALAVFSAVLGNKVPLILSRRVDFVPKNNWFTKWKYNHPAVKRVICVSDRINQIMQKYLDHPEKSITVHSGVDLQKFSNPSSHNKLRSEFELPKACWIIGNTSALEPHKDYGTFIRTIETLKKKNVRLHAFIIGNGSLETALKESVSRHALQEHITFTGFRKDLKEILPCLDVFLMTSNEEGLGTSVLDAFLAKVPVVATAAGGIPEMIEHEKSGLLAPIGDAGALAGEIQRVIENDQLRTEIVTGALEKVSNFSKENTAKKTLIVYIEVLAKRSVYIAN